MLKIKDDSNNVLETYTYGASRNRLKNETSTQRTYYAWGGNSPLVEYTEATASSTPAYAKSYVYAGSRLVSTAAKATSTTETTQYHHADRLGTRLVTNNASTSSYQQSTLPFGAALAAESTGSSNQLFTSYDRSAGTGLDYAVNRTYSQGQGRFTQVDPIGMAAASAGNPQSNNLYGYVQNMPVDFVDPSGLLMGFIEIRRGLGCVLEADGKFHCTEYIDRYWFDDGGTWDDPEPSTGDGGLVGGGGGGGGDANSGRRAARPSNDKVLECLEKIFNILAARTSATAWSWGYSKDGAHGNFSLVGLKIDGFTFFQISASTNFNRDSGSLAQLYNSETSGVRYATQSGYTSPNNREVNWIASDVVSGAVNGVYTEIGVEALFFHEMGNMIANLLGQRINSGNPNDPTKDRDKGQQFENCLYGGRVGLRTGRLGNSREL